METIDASGKPLSKIRKIYEMNLEGQFFLLNLKFSKNLDGKIEFYARKNHLQKILIERIRRVVFDPLKLKFSKNFDQKIKFYASENPLTKNWTDLWKKKFD